MKYGDEAGIIQVRVSVAEDAVSFEVADQGQELREMISPSCLSPSIRARSPMGKGAGAAGWAWQSVRRSSAPITERLQLPTGLRAGRCSRSAFHSYRKR